MSPATPPPATPPLPVQLSASEGAAWLLPPLAMPKRGPQGTRGSYRVLHLIVWVLSTGMPWKGLPVPPDPDGQPAMPSTTVYKVLAPWAEAGALWPALVARVRPLATEKRLAPSGRPGDGTHPRGPTRGDGMGYAGHKPEHGAKGLARPDHQGYGWAPGPVAPVHATAMVRCPEGLKALKRLAKAGGLDRRGA